jgi:sulfate adenylyltransferase large subunit
MLSDRRFESTASFDTFLQQHLERELLRFTTAGSVDDGKSTLIGRLLHDSKSVYEDQLASIKKSRINRSTGPVDFSLLTDGLRAEREQGITIDVAYRYFSTSRRKFIIADTPGHEQYTRNMATGASGSDLAVVLIDGSKGLLPQSRRHTYIARLLGIPHVVAAINKMDLAGYSETAFANIQAEFESLANQLGLPKVICIPVSALEGDNIVSRSTNMPWYQGPTLLEHLETVEIVSQTHPGDLRFPVQYIVRPDANFRGIAGQVASGVVRPGDEVLALPSGQRTRIQSIVSYDGDLQEAHHPMSVTLKLETEIDLSRGEMLVSPQSPPEVSRQLDAMVVWMHPEPMLIGKNYLVKHATRQLRAKPLEISFRVDVNTMAQLSTGQLGINDIGSVRFETSTPMFLDSYRKNRTTGSFILIDPISNATVGAAMIIGSVLAGSDASIRRSSTASRVSAIERQAKNGHGPAFVLVPDRPDLAAHLERTLFDLGFRAVMLDRQNVQPDELVSAARVLQLAGIVTIYSGDPLAANVRASLAHLFPPEQLFEIERLASPVSDSETVERIITALQSLRTAPKTSHREVN